MENIFRATFSFEPFCVIYHVVGFVDKITRKRTYKWVDNFPQLYNPEEDVSSNIVLSPRKLVKYSINITRCAGDTSDGLEGQVCTGNKASAALEQN